MKLSARISLLVILIIPLRLQGGEAPGSDSLTQASTAVAGNNLDEALALYERIFSDSTKVDEWFTAQKGIATVLGKKGQFPAALQAARICLEGAPTLQRYDEAVQLAANIFSAMDQNVSRANTFLEFQKTGAGANPIASIPFPSLPLREKQFATLRAEAGDTAAASRLRAWTFLYSGKPAEGIAQIPDAFRRASSTADLQTAGTDLVVVALRHMRGHASGIENEIEYVISGPNGPDGLTGTADDLKDPFVGLPAPPPPGQGGLAGLPPDQMEALRNVQAAANLYAKDPRMRPELRRDALNALQHANDALDNWGVPGQRDEYFQMALSPDGAGVEDSLLVGAQASAKGRDLHLGGAMDMWKQFNAAMASRGIALTKGMDRTQKQFDSLCTTLRKIKPRKPGFKPLTKPATL